MFNKRAVFAGLFLFLMAENVLAYRPLGTEDAGVAGKGVAQSEVSWDYLNWDNNEVAHENVLLLVPIYGVTENLEISMEIPYLIHDLKGGDSEEGVGDINLVAKYLLIQEEERNPAFAVKGVVKLDNGNEDKGLGSAEKDYTVVAVASKAVGALTLHLQFGYSWIGGDNDETPYGLAFDYAASEPFHVVAEINGKRHPDRKDEENPLETLVGFTYKISDHLILDAGYRRGFTDASPDWSTTMGASITY